MAVPRTLMALAATAMLIQLATAANYTVGGGSNGGWDTSTNLQSWASSQSFLVGDNLIFQYGASHDVLEVSKADFDSCQTSNAIQSYNDGNTVITLTSPGKRYFTCGTLGHCSQGMKVEIDTLATSSPPAASPSTPPAASPVIPVSSPAPEISSPSPAQSPTSAPPMSPISPSDSTLSSPPPFPDVPTTTLPPSGFSPQPPPSSATKGGFKTTVTMGFSLGIVMFLAL